MKSVAVTCAIVCATLGFSTLTLAQGQYRRDSNPEWSQPHQRPDTRPENRFDQRHERLNDRHGYYSARGPDFRQGGYIPRALRDRQYVVTNYRLHQLSPPRRGYQWVQVGSDYVMFAIATGVIASIVLNH